MTTETLPPGAIRPTSHDELRGIMSLAPDAEGLPDSIGVARAHARAVSRWRAPRRRDVLAHTRELVRACGYDEASWSRTEKVLDWMEWRRDVQVASVEEVRHVLPALDRVVWCGAMGFLIGCREDLLEQGAPDPSADGAARLARWLEPGAAEALAAEVDTWTLRDWFGPPTVEEHARRRDLRVNTLSVFWQGLHDAFEARAAGAIGATGVRVIGGRPGEYFGKMNQGQARWRDASGAPDGIYCGARPGYGDQHLHPVLVEVAEGTVARMMDLYDWDELQWALLARGQALGAPEHLGVTEGCLRQTCDLPAQLRRALRCLCFQDRWIWRCPPGTAEDIGAALVQVGGLVRVATSGPPPG